jgi:SAM-dependent methyltransferase
MQYIINRIYKIFARHGFRGGFRECMGKAHRYLLWFIPSQHRTQASAQDRDLEFDRKWGVGTSGTFVPGRSEVVGSNWVQCSKYHGCDSVVLDQILRELLIQHEHFTFVDFGSGKGRAILLASRFPFSRIIGVEYSEQLNEIARHNVTIFPNNEKRCKVIDIVCADAARFPIPKGPLIIFLYNPFGMSLMKEVARNVSTSFQQDPRRIIVIYEYAVFSDIWKKSCFIHEIKALKGFSIYDTQGFKESAST